MSVGSLLQSSPARRGQQLLALLAALALAACGGSTRPAGPGPGPDTGGTPDAGPGPAGNRAPTAAFTADATVQAGEALTFDAAGSSDPDGDALAHAWDFGDGVRGGTARLAHVFAAPGVRTVRLTVADGRGGTATAERTVTVTAGPAPARTLAVTGVVRDPAGAPLAGVRVAHAGEGGASATTDAQGRVQLDGVGVGNGVRVTLTLTREGYATQHEVLALPEGVQAGVDAFFEAVLLPREPAVVVDAASPAPVVGKQGARVELPPGGLRDASGNAVSGSVQVALTPLDVRRADRQAFPGRLEGVAPGRRGALASWGMLEVALSAGGQRLDLAPGQRATVELPLYADARLDGAPLSAGDRVPLWSMDERTGLWVQEGEGTVVASAASPTGLALRGQVAHFSWWNCDDFTGPAGAARHRCDLQDDAGESDDVFGQLAYCNALYGTPVPGLNLEGGGTGLLQARQLPVTRAEGTIPFRDRAAPVDAPVPAGAELVAEAAAVNGLFRGALTFSVEEGATHEGVILLRRVASGGDGADVQVPWDQTYAFDGARAADRYRFSALQGQEVRVVVARGTGSTLGGTLRVLGPDGAQVGGTLAFGVSAAALDVPAAQAGAYTVEVAGTTNVPGSYRLLLTLTEDPPRVAATSPAAGATGVGADVAGVGVTFANDVDAASLTPTSFAVWGPGGSTSDRVTGTVAVAGRVATFTPAAPLLPGVTYTARLSTAVRSSVGTPLPQPHAWTFATQDATGVPTRFALGSSPRVAAGGGGRAVVFTNAGVASVYTPGVGWALPVRLLVEGPLSTNTYDVGMDGSGNALALWTQASATAAVQGVWAARYTPAGGWEAPVRVGGVGDTQGASSLRVRMLPGGTALAAWTSRTAASSVKDVFARTYAPGSGWGEEVVVQDQASASAEAVRIALNAAGQAAALWIAPSSGTFVKRFTPGVGWDASATLLVALAQENADVALSAQGHAIATYVVDRNVLARHSAGPEAAWDPAVPIDASGQPAESSQVAFDAQGNAHAVWVQGSTTTTTRVWAARYAASEGLWAPPVQLEPDATQAAARPRLAVDPAGNAVVAWRLGSTPWDVWAARFSAATGGWGAAGVLDTSDTTSQNPEVAVDAEGNATVVWDGGGRAWGYRFP